MVTKIIGLSLEDLTHPGEHLQNQLDYWDMTQKELAERVGITPKHLNRIIKGLEAISTDVAYGLSKVFPLSAKFWMNLQANYDEEYTKIKREKKEDKK